MGNVILLVVLSEEKLISQIISINYVLLFNIKIDTSSLKLTYLFLWYHKSE